MNRISDWGFGTGSEFGFIKLLKIFGLLKNRSN